MSLRPDVTGVGLSAVGPTIGKLDYLGFWVNAAPPQTPGILQAFGIWITHAPAQQQEPQRLADPSTRSSWEPFDISYWRWKYQQQAARQLPVREVDQDERMLQDYALEAEEFRQEAQARRERVLAKIEQKRLKAEIDAVRREELELRGEIATLQGNIAHAREAIELVRLTKRRQEMAKAAILATIELLL